MSAFLYLQKTCSLYFLITIDICVMFPFLIQQLTHTFFWKHKFHTISSSIHWLLCLSDNFDDYVDGCSEEENDTSDTSNTESPARSLNGTEEGIDEGM